ncbi:serpin B8-like [Pelobates fuscus]|uniref:serpin B8-like n=1 Tax=Pelobates fuscus TaxID=191477 RepID=UPI002FE481BB
MDICVANNQFAIDVLREVSQQFVEQNVIFSPLSIFLTMLMAYVGAGGKTAAQMEEVLQISDIKNVTMKCRDLLDELKQSENNYNLTNINKLFGEQTYHFLPSYLEAVNSSFGAALEKVDFLNNSEEARQYINEWIGKQTEGKIKELLPEGSVSLNTALVIVNSMFIFANWTKQFDVRNTNKRPFKLISNTDINVDTMFMISKFNINYIENPGISVLELPYGTDKYLSMFILLPDNNTVFHMLDKEISYEKLTDWTSNNNMKFLNMAVRLPKFRIEQGFSIRNVLSSLGLTDPFNEIRANFSQMADRDNLHMSDVHHKTFVEVNEKGTEAASATAAVINSRSGHRDEFDANHPFHLFIQEKKTQCILMYGKLYKP